MLLSESKQGKPNIPIKIPVISRIATVNKSWKITTGRTIVSQNNTNNPLNMITQQVLFEQSH